MKLTVGENAEYVNLGDWITYFTYGVFDGENLDSAVMIRFIENNQGELFFKSGGGITAKSKAKAEYEELIQKVYVPIY